MVDRRAVSLSFAALTAVASLDCSGGDRSTLRGAPAVDSGALVAVDTGDAGADSAPPEDVVTERSGSRFRAMRAETVFDDGTIDRVFVGFYDLVRGGRCHIEPFG